MLWTEALEELEIEHIFSPPRRPQTNGPAERIVGFPETKARCMAAERAEIMEGLVMIIIIYVQYKYHFKTKPKRDSFKSEQKGDIRNQGDGIST